MDAELAESPGPEPSIADFEKIAGRLDLLTGGVTTKRLVAGEFSHGVPGQTGALRVTTRSDNFDDHAEHGAMVDGCAVFPHHTDRG